MKVTDDHATNPWAGLSSATPPLPTRVSCTTATSMISEMIWAVSMVRRIYLAVTGDVNYHGLPTEAEWDWTSPGGSYPEGVSPYGAMAEAAVSVTIR